MMKPLLHQIYETLKGHIINIDLVSKFVKYDPVKHTIYTEMRTGRGHQLYTVVLAATTHNITDDDMIKFIEDMKANELIGMSFTEYYKVIMEKSS
jgi:hypothetical protein